MTHGTNPNGLLSELCINTHKADATHLTGSDEMLKAINNVAPLLNVSCLGSSWCSILCIEDSEYAGLLCCCHQQPQHCVVTKIGCLIGRTFLQCDEPNFADRCPFFVFTDELLAKQDHTAPDDFDGTDECNYRQLLDPLNQLSDTACSLVTDVLSTSKSLQHSPQEPPSSERNPLPPYTRAMRYRYHRTEK